AAAAVFPDHAAVPVAGPGWHGAAPVPVDHRVLPADPHRLLPARRQGRPGSRRRPERPGPGHDPAQARRPACRTRPSLLTRAALGARPPERPLLALSPKPAGWASGMS